MPKVFERDLTRVIVHYERKQPKTRIMAVENVSANGAPDLNLCIEGHEFWLELKAPSPRVRPSSKLFTYALRPVQVAWMYSQSKAGGQCFVLASNEKYTCLFDAKGITNNLQDYTCKDAIGLVSPCFFYLNAPLTECYPQVRAAILERIRSCND